MRVDWFVWWLLGLMIVIGIGLLLFQLSPDARLRRRRRKSHSRIISKARRPSVRFSVRAPKEK